MRSFLAIFFFVSILWTAHCQDDFVATNQGDTIYGKIGFDAPESFTESVTIRNEEGRQTINSNKIVLVQLKGNTYRSIRYGNKYRIMQEIVSGYLSLLRYRDGGFEFSNNFLYKATGQGIATSSISFKRSVSEFLQECEVLSDAILDKEYGFRNIQEVVNEYNTNCIKDVSQTPSTPAEVVDLNELQTLLSDILSRKEKNESVPEYLKKALKDFADQDIKSALLNLIESLEK